VLKPTLRREATALSTEAVGPERPSGAPRQGSLLEQIRDLSLSDVPRQAFLAEFFDKVAIALGAEGGGVWLYVERDKRLVCELNRIPEVVAVGDLNPENVNRVVLRAITDDVPILVSRAEAPGEAPGGQDISVVCVGFPIGEGLAGALFLYRNASDGRYFTRESVYLCQSLTPFLALYSAHASSRQVASQTRRLGSLIQLATELADTQSPERIAFLTTNRMPTVVPCERAFLAAVRGERLRVLAIAGHDEVQQGSAQVRALRALASWAARQGRDWYLTEQVVADSDDNELKERFQDYRDSTAMNSCLLMLLKEPGPSEEEREVVGVLAVESREPRVYAPAEMGVLGMLAKLLSATLARARQYADLPAIGLLEGVSKLRRHTGSRGRALRWAVVLGGIVLGLVFGRLPLRAGGVCRVVPERRGLVVARVSGLVREVRVSEGETAAEGQVLILLDDEAIRLNIEEQQKALAASKRKMLAYKATGDQAREREERTNYDVLQAQMAQLRERLRYTRISSPIAGVVLTPRLEDLVDSHVAEGQVLCEVAPLDRLELEVAVPEDLIGYVVEGQKVSFVLSAYPDKGLTGSAVRIGPRSQPQGQRNTFVVTCSMDQPDVPLRPGMTGWGRIHCGRKSAGFILFRKVITYLQIRMFF